MITDLENAIRSLAAQYASDIEERITARMNEMEQDDTSHYLIYLALGISEDEGKRIDIYQNKGRFLYKYAGAFLERAAFLCFQTRFPQAVKSYVPNTLGQRPKQFEIDCLIDNDAIEIKWRDATTDGDHITMQPQMVTILQRNTLVFVLFINMATNLFVLCSTIRTVNKHQKYKQHSKHYIMVSVVNITLEKKRGSTFTKHRVLICKQFSQLLLRVPNTRRLYDFSTQRN